MAYVIKVANKIELKLQLQILTIISIEIKVNINKGKNGVEHMILKIAIADKNSEYIRRILNVLETYGDIDVSVFTDEKSLEGALDNRKFDVLLFDESIVQGIVIEKRHAFHSSFR